MVLAVCLSLLWSCGGGGSSNSGNGNNSGGNTTPQTGRVAVTIDWAQRAVAMALSRSRTRYTPAYALSLQFTLVSTKTASQTYNLTVNRPVATGTPQTLLFTSAIPVGSYTLTGNALTGTDGQGAIVATTSVAVTVQANQTNTIPVTLASTIQSLQLNGAPLQVQVGNSLTLTGYAQDPNGMAIFLPGGDLQWSLVSGAQYATLTSAGLLSGVAPGMVVVKLTEPDTGISAQGDVTIIAPSGSGGGLASSAWPKILGNLQNTSNVAGGQGATGLVKWFYNANAGIPLGGAGVAIGSDNSIYFGLLPGSGAATLNALDGATGAPKWTFPLSNIGVVGSPVIGSDNTVYIGADKVYAVNGATGTQKWTFTTVGAAISPPLLGADGTVYIVASSFNNAGAYQGILYALNGATGAQKWAFQNYPVGYPTLGPDGTLYLAAYTDSTQQLQELYALDSTTGAQKWTSTKYRYVGMPAIGAGNTLYVSEITTQGAHYLVSLDTTTGSQKWSYKLSITSVGATAPVLGANGLVYVESYSPTDLLSVTALNASIGTPVWTFTSPDIIGQPFFPPALGADGTVYFTEQDDVNGVVTGKIYALNGSTGAQLWNLPNSLESAAIGSDGTLYGYGNSSKGAVIYAIK